MKPIVPVRFDALAGYARQPQALFSAEEVAYFEHGNERVLGTVIRDRTDNDFGGLVFGKDLKLCFRCVSTTSFFESKRRAEIELRREMERVAALPDDEYYQGDEVGAPVDFFGPLPPHKHLNPNFLALRDHEIWSPARNIIEPMMRWFEDADGNFIEQFQTAGFDARIWELYLFAVFREMGYLLDRSCAVPDFSCRNPLIEFSVEAVTVNPTRDKTGAIVPEPPHETAEEMEVYLRQYMPIKFARSLTTKLGKRYWEKPNAQGRPLIFAVEDFSAPGSMTRTRAAFEAYITGYIHDWERRPDGSLSILPRKIDFHRWENRAEPSGFFNLPDAENVSAVIFSNSGTITKFNRMGAFAGFGSKRVRLIRVGKMCNPDPDATEPLNFRQDVDDPAYREAWGEGLDVWHNPRALHPIDPRLLPGAAHHILLPDGQVESLVPEGQILSSFTLQGLPEDESE